MWKNKTLLCSMLLFTAAIIGSSLVYLLFDFNNNDVTPNVKIFGAVQLIMTALVTLFIFGNVSKPKQFFLWGIYLSSGILLLIQILPALLWFLFNGITVAETSADTGITGHWIFGAFHLVIILWGAINMFSYRRTNVARQVTV